VATLEAELENTKLSEGNIEQMQLAINRLEEVEARCTSLVAQVQHANASLDHLSGLFTTFYTRLQAPAGGQLSPNTPTQS
jgi:acyl carrier protein phosphodiesterase